jgi:hypothetical protein
MSSQEWYAVLSHRRGNPDTRFAVTCPYCRTLSTLPADGTLALAEASAVAQLSLAKPALKRSGLRRTWVRLG